VNCTIFQSQTGYSNSTQILLGGPECFAIACEIFQHKMSDEGPTGCTGVLIKGAGNSAAEGCKLYGCHIANMSTGIAIAGNSHFTAITACEIDGPEGLTIVPSSATGYPIYGVFVTACKFGVKNYTPSTSGVIIDTAGGPDSNVEGIFLTNCLVYGYQNAGVQINQGQSISVIGGKYSSNGWDPASTIDGAGIAITGPCAQVRIVGADCSGTFDFLGATPPAQAYGISVASDATNVLVDDCDLTGNATAPLYVPTNGTDLRVTNSRGYNDQVLQLTASLPATGTRFNGTTYGYYGPSTVYIGAGANAVKMSNSGTPSTQL
jgi:hypothetical protein